MKYKSPDKWFPLLTLPLILAVCLWLWMTMRSGAVDIEVQSDTGVCAPVAFVPNALLTPKEETA